MLRLKSILLISAIFLLLGATAEAQSQHYRMNGDFANAYFDTGFEVNDIYVSRSDNGKTISTYMSFDLWYSRNYVVSGYGTIPNEAFSGDSGKGVTLDVDITSLQAPTYACDYTNYYYNCWQVTLAGRLQFHWDKTNQQTESYTYTYTSRMPGRHVREKGSQDSVRATASGTMLGMPQPGGIGWIGKTRNVDIDVQKSK